MRGSRYVNLGSVIALRQSPKAVLCEWACGYQDWVPFSQIDEQSVVQVEGDEGELIASKWWAEVSTAIEHINCGPAEVPTSSELRSATNIYRRLAAKYHPDRSPDTAEFMKDLNELWQAVKSDLRKR